MRVHFTTGGTSGAVAACSAPGRTSKDGETLSGDTRETTCEACRETESWREYAELQALADELPDGNDGGKGDVIEFLRDLLRRNSFGRWEGVLVDIQTAHVVTMVHDALSPARRATFAAMPLPSMASVAWKLVRNG